MSSEAKEPSDDDDVTRHNRRGRARSSSFHSNEDYLAEIDSLGTGEEADNSSPQSPSSSSGSASSDEDKQQKPTRGSRRQKEKSNGKTSPQSHPLSSRTREVLSHLPSDEAHIGGDTYQAMLHLQEEEGEDRVVEKKEEKVKRVFKRRLGKHTEQPHYDLHIKLLLLGDQGVGKTSLMLRYAEDKFQASMMPTMGVDYKTQYLDVDDKRVKCQIWDTAGQKNFHVITQAYYRGAHGIVLVYDVSDPDERSFQNVQYWMDNIHKHSTPNTFKVLVGNKVDAKQRKVSTERGKAAAQNFDMPFFETSAKDGTNVVETFHTLAAQIVKKMNKTETLEKPDEPPKPDKTSKEKKSGGHCCIQ